MSTPSSDLPPPPGAPTSTAAPTQIVGQQTAPSSSVPMGTPGSMVTAGPGQTNTLAVVSLVTAIAAPLGHFIGIGGFALIITSIVTGHMARSQIRKTGEGGAGLALAGLIISYVHLAISVLVVILLFGLIIAWIALLFGGAAGR